jgi:hypothetical protein
MRMRAGADREVGQQQQRLQGEQRAEPLGVLLAGAAQEHMLLAPAAAEASSTPSFSFSNPMLGARQQQLLQAKAAQQREARLQRSARAAASAAASAASTSTSSALSPLLFSGSNPMLQRAQASAAASSSTAGQEGRELWAAKLSKSRGKLFYVRLADGRTAWALPEGATLL